MRQKTVLDQKREAAGLPSNAGNSGAVQAFANTVAREGFGGVLGCAGMSVEQAARFLGIGRSLIFEEIKVGRLIAKKAGRRTIILTEDAIAYLRALPSVTPQAAA